MDILWLLLTVASLYTTNAKIRGASSSKSGNYAVPQGQTVRMSCIPPDVLMDGPTTKGQVSFVWTDEEGKEILSPRITLLNKGDLQIQHAHEEDSGVYHCKFRNAAALKHGGAPSKIFVHKLIVYELSGHKFVTVVTFDVTKMGSEATISYLRDLMRKKICASEICSPGATKSESCAVSEMEKQMCEMSMTYEGLEPPENPRCNESCVRIQTVEGLKKAQKLLEATLLTLSEDSKSRLKPEMHTIDTRHVLTCRAGYQLIESNYEHCFPCLPGTSSESESLKCEYCPIGFFQEKYGSQDCEQCPGDRTTETVGSKTRDDCRPPGDTGIMKGLKEGIASLFKG